MSNRRKHLRPATTKPTTPAREDTVTDQTTGTAATAPTPAAQAAVARQAQQDRQNEAMRRALAAQHAAAARRVADDGMTATPAPAPPLVDVHAHVPHPAEDTGTDTPESTGASRRLIVTTENLAAAEARAAREQAKLEAAQVSGDPIAAGKAKADLAYWQGKAERLRTALAAEQDDPPDDTPATPATIAPPTPNDTPGTLSAAELAEAHEAPRAETITVNPAALPDTPAPQTITGAVGEMTDAALDASLDAHEREMIATFGTFLPRTPSTG